MWPIMRQFRHNPPSPCSPDPYFSPLSPLPCCSEYYCSQEWLLKGFPRGSLYSEHQVSKQTRTSHLEVNGTVQRPQESLRISQSYDKRPGPSAMWLHPSAHKAPHSGGVRKSFGEADAWGAEATPIHALPSPACSLALLPFLVVVSGTPSTQTFSSILC